MNMANFLLPMLANTFSWVNPSPSAWNGIIEITMERITKVEIENIMIRSNSLVLSSVWNKPSNVTKAYLPVQIITDIGVKQSKF